MELTADQIQKISKLEQKQKLTNMKQNTCERMEQNWINGLKD